MDNDDFRRGESRRSKSRLTRWQWFVVVGGPLIGVVASLGGADLDEGAVSEKTLLVVGISAPVAFAILFWVMWSANGE